MSGGRFLNRRPPHVPMRRGQRLALDRALRAVSLPDGKPQKVSPEAMHAVLDTIAAHADGAGFAFLNARTTLVAESGWSRRVIFRAIAALEEAGLIERYPFLRDPNELDARLPRQARQGQGPSTYRFGRVLRDAADLRHPDPTWEASQPPASRQTTSVAPPQGEAVAPPEKKEAVLRPEASRATPGTPTVAPPEVQALPVRKPETRGTPVTEELGKPLSNGAVDLTGPSCAGAREALDRLHASWAEHHAEDAAILRELELAFPGAYWIDNHVSGPNEILIDLTPGATEEAA